MPIRILTEQDKKGFNDKLLMALSAIVDNRPRADFVTFAEGPEFLSQTLYPRQRLIGKIFYKIKLDNAELADIRQLLTADNRYARAFVPGISKDEALTLSDEELQRRLLNHYATTLLIVGGRRGSKSAFGAFAGTFSLYEALHDIKFRTRYNIMEGADIGIANVATNEEQALILFNQLVTLIENAPFFKNIPYRPLETKVEFTGRNLYAKSLHSNSSAVRGLTLLLGLFDEFAFFNKSGGKLSDENMWAALSPAIAQFKGFGKLVLITSPLNKAGIVWKLFDLAERGEEGHTIVFQLATWEMNPHILRDDASIAQAYNISPQMAEMEYGAQFAEQFGNFLPEKAIDKCTVQEGPYSSMALIGEGKTYVCHVDLAKNRDECALAVAYYDEQNRKVRVVHTHIFNGPNEKNEFGELSLQAVEDYIIDLTKRGFNFARLTFDQFNSLGIIQRLRWKRVAKTVEELTFTEKFNTEIYNNLRALVMGNGIAWYDEGELVRQLKNLTSTLTRSNKFKVEAPLGDKDDVADCIAVVARTALEAAGLGAGVYAGTAPASGGTLPDEVSKQHSPECTAEYCIAGCPVQLELARLSKEHRMS
jgi:hypothetical protein